jgi:hypothetical protein
MNFNCEICEKIFKKKCHLKDHLNRKYPCQSKKNIDDDTIKENIVKENIVKENITDNNYLQTIEELKMENGKLKQEIERLIIEIKKNNDTVIINNVNNINNGNITINNNINIIQIVNHGEEDYTKINMKEILKKLENPPLFERLSSMIYYIHCNDEFPEYQNIYVTDLSRSKMKVYKEGEWKVMETKPAINALYNKIIEHYDEDDEENEKIFSFIKKESNKTYPCSPNYTDKNRKTAINNSINVLYENRERIKSIKKSKKKYAGTIK